MQRSLHTMCETALGAVLLALGAWITVPFTPPFTMQTFVLYGLLRLFGGRQTLVSVGLYLLLGAVGLPVFAGFQSGVGVLFGPTGGYLFGFLAMALIGCIPARNEAAHLLRAALGTLACYACGTVWYALVYSEATSVGAATAVFTCVLPFLLPDALKLLLATVVCKRLEPHIIRLSQR